MAVSRLSQTRFPLPGFVLTPETAARILHENKIPAARPHAGREQASLREAWIIANLRANPSASYLRVGTALEKVGEPPLSLSDFGAGFLPDGGAIVLTDRPLVRTLAWFAGKENKVAHEVTAQGAVSQFYFSWVQHYFNDLMTGRTFLYPNDGFARQLNSRFGPLIKFHGIDGFTMNGGSDPFFSLQQNREISAASFYDANKRIPFVGVVLADERCLAPFVEASFASRPHST